MAHARALGIGLRSIDDKFYKRKAWESTRDLYLKSVDGLCERCLANGLYVPAVHVHHKAHLNSTNIADPEIAYGFKNLEALCLECHNKEHFRSGKRYKFDNDGNIVYMENEDE